MTSGAESVLFLPDLAAGAVDCHANPTKIDNPYWKYMIARGEDEAYDTRRKYGITHSAYVVPEEPIYCFSRFGRTETILPDGRVVYIAGEHEDFYDPDFYIYNDVVVVHGYGDRRTEIEQRWELHGTPHEKWMQEHMLRQAARVQGASAHDIDIYCYPHDVFLPTDFHTATYVKDERGDKEYIYIIGGLGYHRGPHRTATLTHRLDLDDFSMQRMETSGDEPPALEGARKHRTAELGDDGTIKFMPGQDEYRLVLADMRWHKDPANVAGG